jgi:cell wall-associated NlpC family hydrolase
VATADRAFNRRTLTTVGLTLAALLAVPAIAVPAIAAPAAVPAKPKPSLAAAKHRLDQLNTQVGVLVQKYDQAQTTLAQARHKLAAMQKSVTVEQATYKRLHGSVAQMAASAYKAGDPTAVETLLSAQDPSTVLDQVSIFTKISTDRSSQLSQFVSSAQRLEFAHGQAQQALADVNHTMATLRAQKVQLDKDIAQQMKAVAAAGGIPKDGDSTRQPYIGPATGKALKALQYAFSKLGDSYVYGATGPSTFDCSGLTLRSWEAAGMSIPRTSQAQYSFTAGSRISFDNLQPGDLVFFYPTIHHVGMYVGNGMMIQAPQTGDVVKISDITGGSYRQNFKGGGRITG